MTETPKSIVTLYFEEELRLLRIRQAHHHRRHTNPEPPVSSQTHIHPRRHSESHTMTHVKKPPEFPVSRQSKHNHDQSNLWKEFLEYARSTFCDNLTASESKHYLRFTSEAYACDDETACSTQRILSKRRESI